MQIDNVSLNKSLPLLKAGRAARNAAGSTTSFLLEGKDDQITIFSSNQFSETSCVISAKNVKAAAVSIPPEFAEIAEKCPNDPIHLKLTDKRVEVSIGRTKAKLPLRPSAAFPRLEIGAVKML